MYCHREGPKGAILKIQASRWCKKRSYGLGKKEDRKIFIHAVPASTAVNNIQDAARWMEDNPRGLQISEIRRKRYAPFQGEALAIAWSLEQMRYFTQDWDNLFVVTDHSPLTALFGDRTLDEGKLWQFDVQLHKPG